MKRLRMLTIVSLVTFSVFLVTGVAMAVTVFTPTDDNIFLFEYKSELATMGVSEFGIYEFNNINNLMSVIGSAQIQAIKDKNGIASYSLEYTANTDGSGTFSSDGQTLTSTSGQFQFYYIQNGTSYYPAEGVAFGNTNPPNEYDFLNGNVELHDMTASSVPIPATALLFTSGFAGLIGFRRRKK